MKTKNNGVKKAALLIERRYKCPISVEKLVAVSGMSKRGFHKAFLRVVGRSPYQHLQDQRMLHARKLLIRNSLEIKEVAIVCGYRSLNTFYIAFKRTTGMPPDKYRRKESCLPKSTSSRFSQNQTSRREAYVQ